jgi:hypothetical protein
MAVPMAITAANRWASPFCPGCIRWALHFTARAVMNHVGLGANVVEENTSFNTYVDAAGRPLDGSRSSYSLRLDPPPEVAHFWSVTLYDADTGQVTANALDRYSVGSGEEVRQAADDYMSLMTPVIKGVLTDKGFESTVLAQQVFGGHGYIAEHGMEQFVRDARIAMIYEGANGIQALDLVGRKLGANGGRAVQAFFKEVGDFCEANRSDEKMAPFTKGLKKGLNDLQAATMWLMQNAMAKPDNAGAASTDYMHLFGLVALGYMWGRMVKSAQEGLANGSGESTFLEAKLATGRFYFDRVMPESAAHLARISTGADSMMALEAEAF